MKSGDDTIRDAQIGRTLAAAIEDPQSNAGVEFSPKGQEAKKHCGKVFHKCRGA